MDAASLSVIRLRAHEIAAVVINPLQAFHPNAPPPSDLVLASNLRDVSSSTKEYRQWLATMREACTKSNIALIFDEVYTGFRLAAGGAQEYFNVAADVVVYGKTLGGGMPVGIVCGSQKMMNRQDATKPLRVAYVVGTFAAHPLLVGSMNAFLKWSMTDKARNEYNRLRLEIADWVQFTNSRLDKEFGTSPLQLSSYSSVWTMIYR